MQQPPVPPLPPGAPVLSPGQITVGDAPLTSPSAIYQGYRAQRRELTNQLERLQDSREELSASLRNPTLNDADKKGLEQRITSIDERIASVDKQIMEADAQVARSAAVPGATVEPPSPPDNSVDDGVYVVSSLLVFFVLMPIAVAYSRRIWKRTAKVVTTFPKELSDRLMRVEQSVEATALEVERIGEGQRFMTRLFTEGPGAQQLAQRQAERIGSGSPGNPAG